MLKIYTAALQRVEGGAAVQRRLQTAPLTGAVTLVAVGKAAQAMALGACAAAGDAIRGGLVISKPGHLEPGRLAGLGLEALEGGHPVPTRGSLEAGRRLLELLDACAGEALLFLISGGASSLVEVPVAGLALEELERVNRWLLGSGLEIGAMNRVRKSLSAIKGGGLLSGLAGRPVRALAISDVPGDEPGVIGSGLLVPEPDLAQQVRGLALPNWLQEWVERGLAERGEPAGNGPDLEIVASLDQAKSAAAEAAGQLGLDVFHHPEFIAGDATEAGWRLARSVIQGSPGVHIWGGEPTVQLPPHPGRGGRNQHLALAAAVELAGRRDCLFLSAGTDGTDGPTDDAGALVDGGTLERAAQEGLDAQQVLQAADAGTLLEASGDLVNTGPSGTNVMDLMIGMKIG